jgi:hypothetical protein
MKARTRNSKVMMISTSLEQHRPPASGSRDIPPTGRKLPRTASDRFPAASDVQNLPARFATAVRPGICIYFFQTQPSQENDMPNRGELPNPRRAKDAVAPGPSDAWPIICFCAAGALMSIYMAVSYVGIDAVPRLMSQFPGG